MSFSFELNHTLTELQLLLNTNETDESFLPFQKISIGNKLPIIFLDFKLKRNIQMATWNHIFSNEMIPIHQINEDFFKKDFFRCVVPIDGFFYEDKLSNKSHYFEINKSLIFAVAISDTNNNINFVSYETQDQFVPISPLFITLNDIDKWLGQSWDSIFTDEKEQINFNFMQYFDNLENEDSSPVCFQYLFNEIQKSRIKLNEKLKQISPKINQFL